MLNNHLLSFIRNLKRNRGYAMINISGLAIGFASALLIAIYVFQEFTFDKHHKDYENIYRLSARSFAFTSIAHLEYLNQNISGINSWVELIPSPGTLKYNETSYLEDKTYFTTNDYFKVFEQKLVLGNEKTAFDPPNALIITQSMSKKMFGSRNPIGESIGLTTRNESNNYVITGVIKDPEVNSHLKFEVLAKLTDETFEYYKQEFRFTIGHGYFRLESKSDIADLQNQVDRVFAKRMHLLYGQDQTFEEYLIENQNSQPLVMNISDIHLKSKMQFEASPPGKIEYLYMFIGVAIFIIILAAINYVNLATAQASKRAKEIGVRKVMGSINSNLVLGLISESVVLSVFSFFLGIGLAGLALELMQTLGFSNFNINIFSYFDILLSLFAVSFVTGFSAGIYPAFYLVGFSPIAVLRGNHKTGKKSKMFRSSLVVFQFVVSLSLTIFTIFIFQQMKFSLQKDIGFNKENVLVIDNSKGYLEENVEAFRNELKAIPAINEVAFSHFSMIDELALSSLQGIDGDDQFVKISYKYVDHNFIKTMGFNLVKGRNFDSKLESDKNGIIINKKLEEILGGEVIGKKFDAGFNGEKVVVIGVLENFHFQDFSHEIEPVAFFYRDYQSLVSIRMNGSNPLETVQKVAKVWSQYSDEPIDYYFFDQRFNELFESEKRLGQIVTIFTGLSIFIAFLGLIGLISYQLDQRIKEIGIRKVLGASITQILSLFSKEFTRLVIIAIGITMPIGAIISSRWLDNFAYHIEVQLLPFALVAMGGILLTVMIVSIRSLRSASINPVNTLRSE